MTNKERLDAIKGRAMFNQLAKRTGEITHSLVTLDEEDYDWLIEQAERAQELGEKNRKLDFAIGSYSLQVSEISQMIEREVQGMKKLSNRMVKGESE